MASKACRARPDERSPPAKSAARQSSPHLRTSRTPWVAVGTGRPRYRSDVLSPPSSVALLFSRAGLGFEVTEEQAFLARAGRSYLRAPPGVRPSLECIIRQPVRHDRCRSHPRGHASPRRASTHPTGLNHRVGHRPPWSPFTVRSRWAPWLICTGTPLVHIANVVPLGVISCAMCGHRRSVRCDDAALYRLASSRRCEHCGHTRHHVWRSALGS